MPIHKNPKKFYEKDRIDLSVDEFAALKKPTQSDLNKVATIAQVQAGLNIYRAAAKRMTPYELENEAHNSQKLGKFMELSESRPHPLCDAHAVISGAHTRSCPASRCYGMVSKTYR